MSIAIQNLFFLIEKYLTCNIILGSDVQHKDLIFVLTEIYELNSYNPSILFADIKIDVFNDIPVAIISMNPDREDKI